MRFWQRQLLMENMLTGLKVQKCQWFGKKKYGKGKVFYTSLGHTVDVFDIPEAITIMQRGILWALGDLTD